MGMPSYARRSASFFAPKACTALHVNYTFAPNRILILAPSLSPPFPPLALAALSVPTTRALSLIVTSRDVYREDAPSDARQPEKGAIVCRVAPSWLRFGNFEIFHSRKDAEGVRRLAEFIAREVVVVPENKMGEEKEEWNRFGRMFREVARRTAQMVAGWQSVGKSWWCWRDCQDRRVYCGEI